MSQRNVFYYDQASNISCVCDPDDGLTYYEYDLLDRTTSVKNPFGEVTYYEYTPGGRVKTKVHGNGAISYYSYDAAQRVSDIKHVKSDLSTIATLDYDYDAVGNPTQITREDNSATYYSYDAIYQLAAETQLDSGGQPQFAAEYDYDAAHNRTVKVVDGTATYYSYNAANELLTEASGAETTYYHYDGCGNTVAKQETAGTTYYAYDTENLLTRVDFAAGGHNYYTYDADSKRVTKQDSDGFREFIYQGPDMLKLQMERDESETTVAQYTMGDGLEAMRRSGTSSFYHYNHLGTTLALTGANEAVTDTYQHDAWGVLLGSTGATVNPHTYVGQQRYYRMPTADLYHLGFRDYAQGLGRFMTVDPAAEAIFYQQSPFGELYMTTFIANLRAYLYTLNCPTIAEDATGNWPKWQADPGSRKFVRGCWDYFASNNTKFSEELVDVMNKCFKKCLSGSEECANCLAEHATGQVRQQLCKFFACWYFGAKRPVLDGRKCHTGRGEIGAICQDCCEWDYYVDVCKFNNLIKDPGKALGNMYKCMDCCKEGNVK